MSDHNNSALDNFQIEDVPSKMILVNPYNDERDINLIVYHSGKILHNYFFRGLIRCKKAHY
jgi:hypothetical protein